MAERVLVLGGSGFIGSHVADRLTAEGYSVIIYDLVKSPYLQPTQTMFIGDVLDAEKLQEAASGCTYLYNFAGLADLECAMDRPIDTVKLNVLGTVFALEAARQAKIKRFIQASTIYVYSKAGSFYRASKQSAEKYIEAYHERYGLDYTVLRYGSLYGRRADSRNGIYRLLKQAITDQKLNYSGSQSALREYIHVTDAAKLSVKILEEQYKNKHLILTGQEKMSSKNLLKMISEIMPNQIEINYGGTPVAGHYEMTPYAFQAKLGLKLVATDYVDLGQGLLDCIEELYELLYSEEKNGAIPS